MLKIWFGLCFFGFVQHSSLDSLVLAENNANTEVPFEKQMILMNCNTDLDHARKHQWVTFKTYVIWISRTLLSRDEFIPFWMVKNMDTDQYESTVPTFSRVYRFVIDAYTLEKGTYVITLHNKKSNDLMKIYRTCYLSIKTIPPYLIITGGRDRTAPSDTELHLSGDLSININKPTKLKNQLKLQWTCSNKITQTDNTNYTQDEILSCNENLFSLDTGRLELTLPAHAMLDKTVLKVILKEHNYTQQQTIRVRKGSSFLEILCTENCLPVKPSTKRTIKTILYCRCKDNCEGTVTNDLRWSVWAYRTFKNITDEFLKDLPDGLEGSKFVINPNFSAPHDTFWIKCEMKKENRFGFAWYQMNFQKELNLRCNLSPPKGLAFETKFQLQCKTSSHNDSEFDALIIMLYESFGEVITTMNFRDMENTTFYLTTKEEYYLYVLDSDYHNLEVLLLKVEITNKKQTVDQEGDKNWMMEMFSGNSVNSIFTMLKQGKVDETLEIINTLLTGNMPSPGAGAPALSNLLYRLKSLIMQSITTDPVSAKEEFEENQIMSKQVNVTTNFYKTIVCKYVIKTSLEALDEIFFKTLMDAMNFSLIRSLIECADRTAKWNDLYKGNFTLPSIGNDNNEECDEESEECKNAMRDKNSMITHNALMDTVIIVKFFADTLETGDGEKLIKTPFYNVYAYKEIGHLMVEKVIKTHDVVVIPPESFNTTDFYTIKLFSYHVNLMWWYNGDMLLKTDMVQVTFDMEHDGEIKPVKKFNHPVHVYFKYRNEFDYKAGIITDTFRVTQNETNFNVHTLNREMFIRRIHLRRRQTAWVHIHASSVAIRAVLTKHRYPHYGDLDSSSHKLFDKDTKENWLVHRNREDYDLWLYLALYPPYMTHHNDSELNETDIVTVSVSYVVLSCLKWRPTSYTWSTNCWTDLSFNMTHAHCMCYYFSIAAADISPAVTDIVSLERCDIQLQWKINYVVFLWLVAIYVIYTWLLLLVLKQTMQEVYYLADNYEHDLYAYLLIIKTSDSFHSGTTSNVLIKLTGDKRISDSHVLNYPDPEMSLLQSSNEDWFILTTNMHLGNITKVDLWFDSIGSSPTWKCRSILIHDMQTNEEWYFLIRKIFHATTMRHFTATNPIRQKITKKTFRERFRTCNKYHSWYLGHSTESFSYFKRITVNFSTLIGTNALALMAYGCPHLDLLDTFETNTYYRFDWTLARISFTSSIISFLVHITITWLFRLSKIQFPTYEVGKFPFLVTVFCWVSLVVIIVCSTSFLLIFGWSVPKITSHLWLISSLIGMIANIIVYENTVILIRNFCFPTVVTMHYIEKKTNGILLFLDRHRTILYKKFGPNLLRPYFRHLYKSLTHRQTRRKLEIHRQRQSVIQELEDLFFIIVFLFMLWYSISYRVDPLTSRYHDEIKDLMEGKQANIQMGFYNVTQFQLFYKYISGALFKSMYTTKWYQSYRDTENGLMKDFSNKYLGVIRFRQHRVKERRGACEPRLNFMNMSCIPAYSEADAETRNFEQGWEKESHHLDSYYHKEQWLYNAEAGYSYVGNIARYPRGGYVTYLRRQPHEAFKQFERMAKDAWIDHKTRAVQIEFFTYNMNYNMFGMVVGVFEMTAVGFVISSLHIYPARFYIPMEWRYLGYWFCRITLMIWIIILFLRRMWIMLQNFGKNVRDVWMWIDLLIPTLAASLFGALASRSTLVSSLSVEDTFADYSNMIWYEDVTIGLVSVVIAITSVRLWKLLRFTILFRVVEHSTKYAIFPLLGTFLCYMVIIFSFSLSGFVAFSSTAAEFHSLGTTFSTLMQLSLSFFDPQTESETEKSYLGCIFLSLFIICSIFMKILFISITMVSYIQARYNYSVKQEYSIKDFIMEKAKYLPKIIKFKFRRMRGGSEQDDEYVTPKGRCFARNWATVNTLDIELMATMTKCVVRNEEKRVMVDELNETDFDLMKRITILMLKKKTNVVQDREVFYRAGINETKDGFIDSRRMKEAERIVKVMLNPDIKPPETTRDPKLQQVNGIIKQGLKTLQNCTRNLNSLKKLEMTIDNLDI